MKTWLRIETGGTFANASQRIDVERSPCPTVIAAGGIGPGGGHSGYWLEYAAEAPPLYEVKRRVIHDTSGLFSVGDVTDRPCPTITVGVNSLNSSHYQVEYQMQEKLAAREMRVFAEAANGFASIGEGTGHAFEDVTDVPMPTVLAGRPTDVYVREMPSRRQAVTTTKPPYRVPSMTEIAALPWNGLTAVSTFSGCGGSSLGYKMAGFRVAYANEFVPEAQATYRANHPKTYLDTRDIRKVTAADIVEATGIPIGEIDLFDGSPPCASFSTAGKRESGWGKVKTYSDTVQRSDDLFFEYARLVRDLQPRTFVAENVSGLVKGTAKGYFLEILAALKAAGYHVEARVCDAQWLGVPQTRQRLIFVGVRNDIGLPPVHPKPLAYRYSVRDALPWITKGSLQLGDPTHKSKPGNNFERGEIRSLDGPCPTVKASPAGISGSGHTLLVEAESDMTGYAVGAEWDKLKPGEQSEKYFSLVRPHLDAPSPTITGCGGTTSIASVTHPTERRKFSIAELRRICGFPDDFILTGTYAQQWERLGRAVPPVMMSHIAAAVRDRVLLRK